MDSFLAFIQSFWMPLVLGSAIAYLLGSVNFAIVVTRCMKKGDIRQYGSGNAGATNVLRSQGKGAAALTTLGDLAKSMLAVWIGGWLITHINPDLILSSTVGSGTYEEEHLRLIGEYIAGLFCILGHLYPLYFGFRGGKGVLATLGMMLILDWRVALISLGVFIIALIIGRMVSLGSILAGVTMVICTFLFRALVDHYPTWVVALCTIMALIIVVLLIFKHVPNIKRILNGTESKIGSRHKDGEGK